MWRLLGYLKPYKWKVAGAILALFFTSLVELALPYLTKIGIDKYIANDDFNGLLLVIWLYLFVLVMEFGLKFTQTYAVNWIGQKAMYDLRSEVFSHIQKLTIPFFDKNPVGRLVTRVTTDIGSLHEMLSSGVVAIFGDLFKLGGIIIILVSANWKLALVTFSVMPVLFFVTFFFRKRVRDIYRLIRVRIASINTFLQESVSGISVIQLFNREEKSSERFAGLNADHRDAHLKTILYYGAFFPTVRLLSSAAIAMILWYGGGQILKSTLTFGALVAFIQYAEMFFRPIMDLSEKYNLMQSAMASSERIFALLEELPEPKTAVYDSQFASSFKGEIEFENVYFSYHNNDYVLKDISFKVKSGEKIAFVGATGAGKTTILSLLLRFYEAQKGRILIDGTNIKEIDPQQLRKQFGMVQQDIFIFDGSIARNIKLTDQIDDAEVVRAAREVYADGFIQKFKGKYNQPVLERGKGLSVGQRQLLSFARALAHNPSILVLDEATSSVDTDTEQLIQNALEKLMRSRTSLIVAHRLSTIQSADRIIVMHKGMISETGTHSELLEQNGIYKQLYKLQYAEQETRALSKTQL